MGKTKADKPDDGKQGAGKALKPKQRLKLKLGAKGYKALKKRCCDPKHPHCRNCPVLKALGGG
jgi:hypothetical protein